jgi:hypothetical protein
MTVRAGRPARRSGRVCRMDHALPLRFFHLHFPSFFLDKAVVFGSMGSFGMIPSPRTRISTANSANDCGHAQPCIFDLFRAVWFRGHE